MLLKEAAELASGGELWNFGDLGLPLRFDIIVKPRGGTLAADGNLGEFTEFAITLPRATAPGAGAGAGEGR